MLNETIIFRATDSLAEAIQQCAGAAQLTVSEYLREIVASSVGVPEIVSPVCAKLAQALFGPDGDGALHSATGGPASEDKSDPDPISLLAAAGSGDTQAQRELADMAIRWALSGQPQVDPFIALSEGLIFARLADRHGETGDAMRVVRMLALASMLATGDAAQDMAGEAIARLEGLANGDSEHSEYAAELLASHAQHERSETMRLARKYRDRLYGARSYRRKIDEAS